MSFYIILEVFPIGSFPTSISDREVVILKNIVVLFSLWLTIREGDNEEVRLELFDRFALHDDRGNHFILSRFSEDHLLSLVSVAEHIISLKGLALIGDHVGLDTDFSTVSFGFDHNSNKLRDLVALGVVNFILFLVSGNFSDLLGGQEHILINGGENETNSLEG